MANKMVFPANPMVEDEAFNVAIMGDSGVGKSTFLSRLGKHWTELTSIVPKKGEKHADDLHIRGRDLIAEFVDTSSKARFPFLQSLPSCDVFVLVYSIVDDKSFQSVCAVREQILKRKGNDVPIVFVANKSDIAGSVDMTERAYRDLNISCEWENGHEEISAETDASIMQVLEQIMKRHHKCRASHEEIQSYFQKKMKIGKFFARK